MSPTLFNVYSELIMRKALEDWQDGFDFSGEKLADQRYEDDVVLIASSEALLQQLAGRVGQASGEFGLRLKGKKIRYNGDQVEEFVYLGALFKSTCTDQETRRRISMAK